MIERRFDDCWKRIERADTHRNAVRDGWNSLLGENSHQVTINMEDQRTGVARAFLTRPIKNDLALLLGEFFYQLRAALDGAVYRAAILLNPSMPPPDESSWEFPVLTVDNSEARRKFRRNVGELPDQLRSWIESIQPYHAQEDDLTWIRVALGILHDCARKDRHRRLHVVVGMPRNVGGQIGVEAPGRLVSMYEVPCNLLENESDFLRFEIENFVPGMNVYFKGEFTVEIAMEEIPGVWGAGLGGAFGTIQRATEFIVNVFEKSFDLGQVRKNDCF